MNKGIYGLLAIFMLCSSFLQGSKSYELVPTCETSPFIVQVIIQAEAVKDGNSYLTTAERRAMYIQELKTTEEENKISEERKKNKEIDASTALLLDVSEKLNSVGHDESKLKEVKQMLMLGNPLLNGNDIPKFHKIFNKIPNDKTPWYCLCSAKRELSAVEVSTHVSDFKKLIDGILVEEEHRATSRVYERKSLHILRSHLEE